MLVESADFLSGMEQQTTRGMWVIRQESTQTGGIGIGWSDAGQVCLAAFEVVPVDRGALERAQQLPGPDFEASVQMACAEAAQLDAIVTRDLSTFAGSPASVWSPAECLGWLSR